MQSNIKVKQSCSGICFQSPSEFSFFNIYVFYNIGAGVRVGAGGAFSGTGVERLRHSVCF